MSTRMKTLFCIATFIVTFVLCLPQSIRYWETHLPDPHAPTVQMAVDR